MKAKVFFVTVGELAADGRKMTGCGWSAMGSLLTQFVSMLDTVLARGTTVAIRAQKTMPAIIIAGLIADQLQPDVYPVIYNEIVDETPLPVLADKVDAVIYVAEVERVPEYAQIVGVPIITELRQACAYEVKNGNLDSCHFAD